MIKLHYDPAIMPLDPSHPCEMTIAAMTEEQRQLMIRPYGSPALNDSEVEVARSIARDHPNVLSVGHNPRFPYVLNYGQKVRLTLIRRYGVDRGGT